MTALRSGIESVWSDLRAAVEPDGVKLVEAQPATMAAGAADSTSCALCQARLQRSTSVPVRQQHYHAACANFYLHLWKE